MLVIHPALYISSRILPADPPRAVQVQQTFNRTAFCKQVGDFISSYPSMSWDTIQPSRWETVRWNSDTNITF